MFVKELGKKAGVPSVYTLTFYMLGDGKTLKTSLAATKALAEPGLLVAWSISLSKPVFAPQRSLHYVSSRTRSFREITSKLKV